MIVINFHDVYVDESLQSWTSWYPKVKDHIATSYGFGKYSAFRSPASTFIIQQLGQPLKTVTLKNVDIKQSLTFDTFKGKI
jgi:hypothetical protein